MITNRDVRSCEDELIAVLNKYDFPYEFKRIMLSNLSRQCGIEADKAILNESITEKGEMNNGTELD